MGWGSVSSASCTSQFVRRVIRCQVCAGQLLTRNCSPGLWAQRALDCASAFALAAFPHCFPLVRCSAGQNSSLGRNSAQNWPFIAHLRALRLLPWCLPPGIPNTILRTISYATTHLVWQGRPLDLCLCQAGCLTNSGGHGPYSCRALPLDASNHAGLLLEVVPIFRLL